MLRQSQLQQLVRNIQNIFELQGAPIGYYDGNRCETLFTGNRSSATRGIVVEEISGGAALPPPVQTAPVVRTFNPFGADLRFVARRPVQVRAVPQSVSNRSQATTELVGLGLNCGSAVISAIGLVASGAAVPWSGGTSLFVAAVAWTGLVTSTALCTDSIIRFVESENHPNSASLSHLDRDQAYSATRFATSAVGIASGGYSGVSGLASATSATAMSSLALAGGETAMAAASTISMVSDGATRHSTPRGQTQRLYEGLLSSLVLHVFTANSGTRTRAIDSQLGIQ